MSELCGDCGMDFAWIDAEHCPHTIEGVMRHLIALRGTGCADSDCTCGCDCWRHSRSNDTSTNSPSATP